VPGFELAADYRTSGEVGGDYFDYVPMADGRTLVAVADVSGHNLASGMVMVGARATLRTLAAVCDDAGRLMTDLGATMYADLTSTERFITAVGVALRPGEGTVEVVNAGHNEVLWYRAESGLVESLSVEGTVLGFLPGVVYGTQTLQMQAGDCLFLYTDGVTEAQDDSGEMFGEERLVEVVRHACRKGAADVVASVMTAVERYQSDHELGDDITLVAIKATGPQERT
jgi:sigma-B regulation protein RsbU (phosphoserine phosphatase)